jgi:hypothetical protein
MTQIWGRRHAYAEFLITDLLTAVYWTKLINCCITISASSFNCLCGESSEPNLKINKANHNQTSLNVTRKNKVKFKSIQLELLLKIAFQVVPLRIFASISKTHNFARKYFQFFSAKIVQDSDSADSNWRK